MVKVERSFPAPASLAVEAQKVKGSYSMPDVVKQLKEDFHNKCYICELSELQMPRWNIYCHILTENIQSENLTGIIFSGRVGIAIM